MAGSPFFLAFALPRRSHLSVCSVPGNELRMSGGEKESSSLPRGLRSESSWAIGSRANSSSAFGRGDRGLPCFQAINESSTLTGQKYLHVAQGPCRIAVMVSN